jgi:hypothetical protein
MSRAKVALIRFLSNSKGISRYQKAEVQYQLNYHAQWAMFMLASDLKSVI